MDVDYDDMIEDYIQQGNEEPSHDDFDYEESLLEEMEMAAAPTPARIDNTYVPPLLTPNSFLQHLNDGSNSRSLSGTLYLSLTPEQRAPESVFASLREHGLQLEDMNYSGTDEMNYQLTTLEENKEFALVETAPGIAEVAHGFRTLPFVVEPQGSLQRIATIFGDRYSELIPPKLARMATPIEDQAQLWEKVDVLTEQPSDFQTIALYLQAHPNETHALPIPFDGQAGQPNPTRQVARALKLPKLLAMRLMKQQWTPTELTKFFLPWYECLNQDERDGTRCLWDWISLFATVHHEQEKSFVALPWAMIAVNDEERAKFTADLLLRRYSSAIAQAAPAAPAGMMLPDRLRGFLPLDNAAALPARSIPASSNAMDLATSENMPPRRGWAWDWEATPQTSNGNADVDSVSVRGRFANSRKSTAATADLFAFERYNAMTDWRNDKSKSPDGMKATKWKAYRGAGSTTTSDLVETDLFETTIIAPRRAQAPDVQLMEFSRPPRQVIPIRALRDKYGSPVAGSKCISMTLGGGMRVYFPVVASAEKTTTLELQSSSVSRAVLGVSMEALIQRVNATRRRKEHENQQLAYGIHGDEDLENVHDFTRVEPVINLPQRQIAKDPDDNMLWVDKHAPATFSHLLSDERTNREVLRALRAWDPYVFHKEPLPRPLMGFAKEEAEASQVDTRNRRKKTSDVRPEESSRVILLSGPAGIGKTTLAHIIARHAGYRPIEVNGSDERSASVLTERLIRAMESSTLNFTEPNSVIGKSRPNCIIMDEIDGADAKGAVKALIDIIRADIPPKKAKRAAFLRRPIIFICNNKWASALRPLLPFAKQFDLSPPTPMRLVTRLQAILKLEALTVSGGSSMLNNLVMLSGADIRSCLYTLQFTAYRARQLSNNKSRVSGGAELPILVDIGEALFESMGGNGMKDERKDVSGTIAAIFRKHKDTKSQDSKLCSKDTDRVAQAINTFGDSSRVLDSMFLNVLRISYIDPAFDRCALAHEWLSVSDTYRSQTSLNNLGAMISVQDQHIPTTAAAIHLLCRVEQRSELTYTVRDFFDNQFKLDNSLSLVRRFAEGISPQSRCGRSLNLLVSDFVPYMLRILACGRGTGSLDRATTSMELLNANELKSFTRHASLLHSLGLSYTAIEETSEKYYRSNQGQVSATLVPPVHVLVDYPGFNLPIAYQKRDIPPGLKLLLARSAAQMKHVGSSCDITVADNNFSATVTASDKMPTTSVVLPKRKTEASAYSAPFSKKSRLSSSNSVATSQNFLQIGARKAMEAKSARHAARVGYDRSKKNKRSHTGSGVPLSRVLRLKFVKGYTEAVRTPCYLEDLI